MQNKISLQMTWRSHLTAADCASGGPGNIDIRKLSYTVKYCSEQTWKDYIKSTTFQKQLVLIMQYCARKYSKTMFLVEFCSHFGRSILCI